MTAYPIRENVSCWWLHRHVRASLLHAVRAAELTDLELQAALDEGVPVIRSTVCGRTLPLTMPGVLSRLSMSRCRRCCKKLTVPPGNGTPANRREVSK